MGSLLNGKFIKMESQTLLSSLVLMVTGEKLQAFLTDFGNLGV